MFALEFILFFLLKIIKFVFIKNERKYQKFEIIKKTYITIYIYIKFLIL